MTVANRKTVSGFLHVSWRTAGAVARRIAERVKASMSSPFDGLTAVGVDGTGYRKGHAYLTVVVDHERHRVIWAHDGCFASMFVRQVRQCFSVVWADGFPRCRHRFPVM